MLTFRRLLLYAKRQDFLLWVGLILITALPRLTSLNQYLIVDEADRWRWAKNFVNALSRGDLAATVGEVGYPGLVPIWAETVWIWLEAGRRSLLEGRWIGEAGLYLILHEWDRSVNLFQQRLPLVLLNTLLTLLIIWLVWRLFGRWIGLLAGLLIALDPFFLTDSRVNRADALITALMTLSILALIFYDRQRRWRWLIASGGFAGLAFVTKIQALAMLPAIGLILLVIWSRRGSPHPNPRPQGEGTPGLPSLPLGRGAGGDDSFEKSSSPYSLLPTLFSLLPTAYSFLLWAITAAIVWYLLWPAMWVQPLAALGSVYDLATMKVGEEGADLFFFGQAHADPGPLFYLFVFLMRLTPLAFLGFIIYVLRLTFYGLRSSSHSLRSTIDIRSSIILLIYIALYTIAMIPSTHKQDRYLLPIFLCVDILAALGWVEGWQWLKSKIESNGKSLTRPSSLRLSTILLAGFALLQFITVLPHHPYYYSFFNPLLGGGQTAVRTLRIGWGEGMDQVGEYLAAKPNSRDLVVASRFTHNMLGFKGEQISLLPDGRWTQADYIVLYIQQVQRRQEPSPGFIDYFQARPPEKVITIAGIDYAWIYPIPFTVSADPQLSVLPDQAALLGYRWEKNGQLRLFWENLGLAGSDGRLEVRLKGDAAQTEWAACFPDTPFIQKQTPGDYLESLCVPAVAELPPGTYDVEFALAEAEPVLFDFPQGWQAATIGPLGQITDTPEQIRLEAIVASRLPPDALRLDRTYAGQIRLLGYRLDPVLPQPGQEVKLSLYWQLLKNKVTPLRLTVQLADSRSLNLGRVDIDLAPDKPFIGRFISTNHPFKLAAELERPLAGQIEVSLQDTSQVPLPSFDAAGAEVGPVIGRFTIPAEQSPSLEDAAPVTGNWQNGLALKGYTLSPQPVGPGETLSVNLFWTTSQPVAENYMVFVHLLDENGQIKAQNDALPRAGAYPTPWWQPGIMVEDGHRVSIPQDVPQGAYRLVVGFYLPETGARLGLTSESDHLSLGQVEIR